MNRSESTTHHRLIVICSLAFVTLAYILLACHFASFHAFWSPDSGARFAMIRNWLDHGNLVYFRYPLGSVDPQCRLHPLVVYVVHSPKGFCYIYGPLFAWASGVLYKHLGFAGLSVIPVCAGILSLVLAYRCARLLNLAHARYVPLILGLFTPLVIYATVFWDHSLQILITALSVYWCIRAFTTRNPIYAGAAGFALGCGVWVHEVFLALVLAAGISNLSLMRDRRSRTALLTMLIGAVIPIAAWMVFNNWLYGLPLGPHMRANNVDTTMGPSGWAFLPDIAARYVECALTGKAAGAISDLFILLVAACAIAPILSSAPRRVLGALWIAAGIAGVYITFSTDSVRGLLSTTPLLLLPIGILPWRNRAQAETTDLFYAWAIRTAILFTAIFAVPRIDIGMQWGSRMLLTGLPIYMLLVFKALDKIAQTADSSERKWALTGAVALLTASLVCQVRGIAFVRHDLVMSRDICAQAKSAGNYPMISTRWWHGAELTPAMMRNQMLFLRDTQQDRDLLANALLTMGPRQYLYLKDNDAIDPLLHSLDDANVAYQLTPQPETGNTLLTITGTAAAGARAASPTAKPTDRHVMALYYPWYATQAFSGAWRHQELVGANSNQMLSHTHTPLTGPYDSCDPRIVDKHLRQARDAGIDTLVCSWWGAGDPTDRAFRLLLQRASAYGMHVCILWERQAKPYDPLTLVNELGYIADSFGASPAYLRHANRPVVFALGGICSAVPTDAWREVLATFNRTHPAGVTLVGDVAADQQAGLWEGLFSLPVPNPADTTTPDATNRAASVICRAAYLRARRTHKLAVEAVLPGFDDRKPAHAASSPPSGLIDRQDGNTYTALWDQALRDMPDWVLISSFNQWHNGTEIEPSTEMGDRYLGITRGYAGKFRGR